MALLLTAATGAWADDDPELINLTPSVRDIRTLGH